MAAPSSSIEQAIHQTIVQAEQALAQAWDLVSSQSPSLHDLPNNLHSSLNDLYNKVTNNGSLPVPSWKDLPAAFTGAAEPLPPPPPPPPASSPASFLVHLTRRHPILLASVVTAGVTGGAYYFAPGATTLVLQRTVKPLKPFVPLALLPKTDRPARLISEQHGEVRKEAVLVLGAEGTAAELALDLEARGFIVIATVSHPSLVDALEKRSRGWMKVLVLDPTESSSVAPFLRSFSTALSLRFPLHTSGDPYSRPSHALALTSLINCLSLRSPNASETLCPIEALEGEQVHRVLGEKVATVVGVLKGVLPILRSAAGRPGAPEGVVLSLFPAPTANISLPFLSLSSAVDAALTSVFHSLRRELSLTRTSNLRVSILEVGFFEPPQSSASSSSASPSSSVASLAPRLESLYAPALANSAFMGGGKRGNGGTRRKSTPARKLHRKVFEIVACERGGLRSSVGAGAFSYHLLSYVPHFFLDTFLSLQSRLASTILSHRRALPSPTSPRAARGPLPTPPSLRPGTNPSQVHVDTTFAAAPGPSPSAPAYNATQHHHHSDGTDSGEESSLEDLMSESGMGSFVDVSGRRED